MPDQDNPVLMKMHPKIFSHFDAVSCHLRQGHGRRNRFAGCAKSASGATLVPLDDGEIFFPWLPARRHRNGRTTRATVNKEDNRIVAIFAANLNPLVDTADFHVHPLLDAVWRSNREGARAEMLAISAPSKSQAYCENRQDGNRKQACPCDPESPPFHRRAAMVRGRSTNKISTTSVFRRQVSTRCRPNERPR